MNFNVNTNAREVTLKIKGYPKRLVKRVDSATKNFVQKVTDEARHGAPEATSTLTKSIIAKKLGVMDYVTGPTTQYAKFVESGSAPGSGVKKKNDEVIQSLMDWISVRGIKPYSKGFTKQDLAYAIREKIWHEGTTAQPYLYPALEKKRPLLSKMIDKVVRGMDK